MLKFFLILMSFFLSLSAHAKVKSNDINFPGKFYLKDIKKCEAMGNLTFDNNKAVKRVKGFIGYDWHTDHKENSNSLTVKHENITEPIIMMMVSTYNAIANKNSKNIDIAKNFLVEIAKAQTLYDSIGYNELKNKPNCWKDSDVNAPCWYHEYQFASDVFGNYMIIALFLKSELNEKEFKIVNSYIKKMYKKFLKPKQFKESERGFYQMANGGIPTLVYSSWTNDKKLAAKEMNFRFKEINSLFYTDGYINNNSFRGVRAQWYHSYGLNSALAFVYISDLWGANIPNEIMKKLMRASNLVNLAITDYDTFRSRPFTGKYNANKSEDPAHARKHTHQDALGIDVLMKIVTDVKLNYDPVYLKKRAKRGIDDTIGFNPNCIE
tara:strand:- start:184 stop:1323 length:1140 start_codon:yes stop_codon:yes gene_type:complete